MADKPFRLFCYVLGLGNPFVVDIENHDTVSDLKGKIKAEKRPDLDHIPASFLKLWQVTISNDRDDIAEEADRQIAGRVPLAVTIEILDEFREVLDDNISVVATMPYTERDWKAKIRLDSIPPWLLNWHSVLWGKAEERPFSRTVTVTGTTYRELREQLAEIPPQNHDQILQIKRDILKSLPLDTTAMIDLEDTDIEPVTKVETVADMNIDADIALPMRVTYVDLLDLIPCDRIPPLVFYRSEFDELTQAIESVNVEHMLKPYYQFVTGTPGIGKTVYLHLQLVRMLLEGKPFLYQTCNGDVFHFGEVVTKIGSYTPEHLIPLYAFVDFDGHAVTRPASWICALVQGRVVFASSPGPAIHKGWIDQARHNTWAMRSWEPDDLWAALIFLSPRLIDADLLRATLLRFGLNPRVCISVTTTEKLERFTNDIKKAVGSIKHDQQLIELMIEGGALPNWRITYHIFEIVVGDSLGYWAACFRPRSNWVLDLILEALEKNEYFERKAFHDLIASKSITSSLLSQFWERWVHKFFRASLGKQQTLTLTELGTSNPLPIMRTLTIQRLDNFAITQVSSKLIGGQTSYLQRLCEGYPTFDSIIYSKALMNDEDLPSLLLLQIATEAHPLRVKGFKLLRDQLPLSSPLRPTDTKPWAIVFVVPDDRVHKFTGAQTLVGNANNFWQPKIRQFVLSLSRTEAYA